MLKSKHFQGVSGKKVEELYKYLLQSNLTTVIFPQVIVDHSLVG
jgi:hypothetical protein